MTTPTTTGPLIEDWVNKYPSRPVEQTATPDSSELSSKPRRMKRGTAVILAAVLGTGGGTALGLVLADHFGAPHQVNSVVEVFQQPQSTPGFADGDTDVINRGIKDLGLPPSQNDVIDNIGLNPQPGQSVVVEEYKSPVFGNVSIKASDQK